METSICQCGFWSQRKEPPQGTLTQARSHDIAAIMTSLKPRVSYVALHQIDGASIRIHLSHRNHRNHGLKHQESDLTWVPMDSQLLANFSAPSVQFGAMNFENSQKKKIVPEIANQSSNKSQSSSFNNKPAEFRMYAYDCFGRFQPPENNSRLGPVPTRKALDLQSKHRLRKP